MTTAPRSPRSMRLVRPPVDGPDDPALLVAMALGDADACQAFVERHAGPVIGLAGRICRDRALAEDIAQRCFEQAWRHAAEFDPERASARTWLLTITRRLAIDELRRRRPHPLPPPDLEGLLAAAVADPEAAGIASVEQAKVVSALTELPEEQRRAVVMAAVGGMSAREVAEVDRIPLGTAKTRIRLGLRRLRSLLDGEVDRG